MVWLWGRPNLGAMWPRSRLSLRATWHGIGLGLTYVFMLNINAMWFRFRPNLNVA